MKNSRLLSSFVLGSLFISGAITAFLPEKALADYRYGWALAHTRSGNEFSVVFTNNGDVTEEELKTAALNECNNNYAPVARDCNIVGTGNQRHLWVFGQTSPKTNGVYLFIRGGAWGLGAANDEQRAYQLGLEACVKYGSCLPRLHVNNELVRLRVFDEDQYYDFNRPEKVITVP